MTNVGGDALGITAILTMPSSVSVTGKRIDLGAIASGETTKTAGNIVLGPVEPINDVAAFMQGSARWEVTIRR